MRNDALRNQASHGCHGRRTTACRQLGINGQNGIGRHGSKAAFGVIRRHRWRNTADTRTEVNDLAGALGLVDQSLQGRHGAHRIGIGGCDLGDHCCLPCGGQSGCVGDTQICQIRDGQLVCGSYRGGIGINSHFGQQGQLLGNPVDGGLCGGFCSCPVDGLGHLELGGRDIAVVGCSSF